MLFLPILQFQLVFPIMLHNSQEKLSAHSYLGSASKFIVTTSNNQNWEMQLFFLRPPWKPLPSSFSLFAIESHPLEKCFQRPRRVCYPKTKLLRHILSLRNAPTLELSQTASFELVVFHCRLVRYGKVLFMLIFMHSFHPPTTAAIILFPLGWSCRPIPRLFFRAQLSTKLKCLFVVVLLVKGKKSRAYQVPRNVLLVCGMGVGCMLVCLHRKY